MVTSTPRRVASAWIRSIWWLLPSTSAIQVRACVGSRRAASSKTRPTTMAALSVTLAVSHLFADRGVGLLGVGIGAGVLAGGEDVGWGARDRVGVVDGADLGQAFAVAFLALGQPGGQLRGGRGCGCGGGRAQRVGAHDDALAVDGQDQHVSAGTGRGTALGVEVLDVGRGPPGELFGLAFAQPEPGGPFDRLGGVVEGAPCRFEGGQLPQAVRVLLHWQVQCRVGGIQVGVPAAAVGQPGYRHLAEHRGQRAGVPGLDGTAGHLLGVGHLRQALLALRPQVQVVLHQLAEQLATGLLQVGLQFGMLQAGGRGAVEETQRRVEQCAAGGEALVHPGRRRPGHRRPRRAASRPMSAARPASPAVASSASALR
jgi:hypothetical protein